MYIYMAILMNHIIMVYYFTIFLLFCTIYLELDN